MLKKTVGHENMYILILCKKYKFLYLPKHIKLCILIIIPTRV